MTVAAEGGLAASLTYADQMIAMTEVAIAGLEATAASLATKDWAGDAVSGLRAAVASLREAKSNIQRSRDSLARSLTVRDGFHAAPDTGSKDSLMDTGASSSVGGSGHVVPHADTAGSGQVCRGDSEDTTGGAVEDGAAAGHDEEDMWSLLGGVDDAPITHCLSCDEELDQPTQVDEEGFCRYCRPGAPDFCWAGAPNAAGELDEREHVEPFKRLSELASEIEDSKDGRYRTTPEEFEYGSCVVKLPGGKQVDAREWVEQPATQRLLAEMRTYQSATVDATCECGATVTGTASARGYLGSTVTATGEAHCSRCRRDVALTAEVTVVKGLKVFNTVEFTITCRCGATMPGAARTVHGRPGETVKVTGAGHCDSCGQMASHWGEHVMQGADPIEAPERIQWSGTWRRGLLPRGRRRTAVVQPA